MNLLKKLSLSIISFLLFFEITARITDLDMVVIKPLLAYQISDLEVHQDSTNANRLYELKPNAEFSYPHRHIKINSLGFRDKERNKVKAKGVFRIICLGGSNTYGAQVNDNETYPYYLEELLNKRPGKKFEVWNVGCSAYVLSQNIEVAKLAIKEYDPDLLLFQQSNTGRRHFLFKHSYKTFFRKNPRLFFENLRYIALADSYLAKKLFSNSYFYRASVILCNCLIFMPLNNPEYDNDGRINGDRFSAFYKEYESKVPIIMWWHSLNRPATSEMESFLLSFNKGVKVNTIDIFQSKYYPKGIDDQYFKIHPPSYVYKWYADILFKELVSKKYIKL